MANVPGQITIFSQSLFEYEAGKCKLIWDKPGENGSMILHYSVSRDVGSGVFFEVYNGLEAAFTDTGLQSGDKYNYRVKAYNPIGYGPDSSILIATAGAVPL
jgi:hypothetical protein